MDVREKATNGKRLIDANALMDVIKQHEYRLATKQGSIDYGMFTLGIQQAVDEQQTIDAVPVVRCRECKHRYTEDCPMYFHASYWHEGYEEYVDDDTDHTEDDYFCQEGERK